jgi:hypothetical protein
MRGTRTAAAACNSFALMLGGSGDVESSGMGFRDFLNNAESQHDGLTNSLPICHVTDVQRQGILTSNMLPHSYHGMS